jgi:hypothetical protein
VFIGHYGAALAAKRWAPSGSLGTFFLAVQGLDLLFMSFLITGVERMRLTPGFTAYNPYDLYFMPYSHSLLAAVGWSLLAAAALKVARRSTAVAVVVGALVFSHFALDLPMHTPDMPIASDASPKLGLGLWNHFWISFALELAALLAGTLLYVRAKAKVTVRFWVFLAMLVLVSVVTPFMPQPTTPAEFAIQALAAYLVLAAYAAWVDR